MNESELIPHLFRSEFRKITAVLCRQFGLEYLETAEDIAGDTFLAALETWPYRGIPEHPVAWLYAVARNKTRTHLQRTGLFKEKISGGMMSDKTGDQPVEPDLSESNIRDSQLQMMFALCHPSIPQEAQMALCLRILCGFGIEEIANAFLSNKETISKRLARAKEKIRASGFSLQHPLKIAVERLDPVLRTIYLLFNEGYYSESNDQVIRGDLCGEAMRLVQLLTAHEETALPETFALFSLMCFHASRFAARKNDRGEIILYHDQDETLWDQSLIEKGAWLLHKASTGDRVSKYHLEAAIAYWYTVKEDRRDKWQHVLQLYDHLLAMDYSPVAALNRTYAFSKVYGKENAINEAEKLQLTGNRYYFALLGELYRGIDDRKSKEHFLSALSLARTNAERSLLLRKIEDLAIV